MLGCTGNVLLWIVFKLTLYFLSQLSRLVSLPQTTFKTLWESDCNHPGQSNSSGQFGSKFRRTPSSYFNNLCHARSQLASRPDVDHTLFISSLCNSQIRKYIILFLGNFNRLFFNVCSLYLPVFITIRQLFFGASFFFVLECIKKHISAKFHKYIHIFNIHCYPLQFMFF